MGRRHPRFNAKARTSRPQTTQKKPLRRPDGGEKERHPHDESHAQVPALDADAAYVATPTPVPEVVARGARGLSRPDLVPELPEEEEMSAKKRKRLEKFIEKQLKKEERAALLARLAASKFERKDLLRSTAAISRGKGSVRDRLRDLAKLHAAGVDVSTSELFVATDATAEVDNSTEDILNVEEAASDRSDISDPKAQIPVVVFDGHTSTSVVETSNDAAAAPPQAPVLQPQFLPVFGAALKRKADGSVLEPVKRVRKKKKNLSKGIHHNASELLLGSSSDEEHENSEDHAVDDVDVMVTEEANGWKVDVAAGEAEALAKAAEEAKDAAPSIPEALRKYLEQRAAVEAAEANAASLTKAGAEVRRPAFYVPVQRKPDIELSRSSLPVFASEQEIMEAVLQNDVVLLCGETGSGKTTQLPQFLYEYGFSHPDHPEFSGLIGVTQPRRVATISMARRVAHEMNLDNTVVGYQIRYDRSVSAKTRIKFMTDGILLRELSSPISNKDTKHDLLLSKYSAIIIDEAHERTVGTDVLIGWLTRIVKLRNSGTIGGIGPLKLIIMSATLRVEDFTNERLFPSTQPTTPAVSATSPSQSPPVIKVPGRQHKVVIHYNRRTPEDYISEVVRKVSKIHTTLPHGAILVFMSGQAEIQTVVKRLRESFSAKAIETGKSTSNSADEKSSIDAGLIGDDPDATADAFHNAEVAAEAELEAELGRAQDDGDDKDDFVMSDHESGSEEDDVDFLGGDGDTEDVDESTAWNDAAQPGTAEEVAPLHVLPLYSLLPAHAQMRVFEPPPPGHRLCVVATNVAETSLTIPGVRYVVDCGKVKERTYDATTGIQKYQVSWAAKANAGQRAGRAGRQGPGHCYRLYSSAVYQNMFAEFSDPEILRTPLDAVVLQMKAMGIANVVHFPFPSQPDTARLAAAEHMLCRLGALDPTSKGVKVTPLGKLMAKFPVSPRFAKMLVIAAQQKRQILPFVIAIVAGLSVGDPFIRDQDIIGKVDEETASTLAASIKEERRKKRVNFYKMMAALSGPNPKSDLIRLLNVIGAYECEAAKGRKATVSFCERAFVRIKAMEEIRKLRVQLTNLIKVVLADLPESHQGQLRDLRVNPKMQPPSPGDQTLIMQTLLAAYPDHLARLDPELVANPRNPVPAYQTMNTDPNVAVVIHQNSAISGVRPGPRWVVYLELLGREEVLGADGALLNSLHMKQLKKDARESQQQNDAAPVRERLWMNVVTIIEESWIVSVLGGTPMCKLSRMLEQPEPHWDATRDTIMCVVAPLVGTRLWELPPTKIEMPDEKNVIASGGGGRVEKCKWFARAFLEGKVLAPSGKKGKSSPLEAVLPYMQPHPSSMTKQHPSFQTTEKTLAVVQPLVDCGICTKAALLDKLKTEPMFLRDEYMRWINPAAYRGRLADVIKRNWPPIRVVNGRAAVNAVFRDEVDKLVRMADCRIVDDVRANESSDSDYDSE